MICFSSEAYNQDILIPILKTLVSNAQTKEFYENIVDFRQPILLPAEVCELESKQKQIGRLLEKLESHMIEETCERVRAETKLVIAERNRDENTLPTDLWRQHVNIYSSMYTIPHLNFLTLF